MSVKRENVNDGISVYSVNRDPKGCGTLTGFDIVIYSVNDVTYIGKQY